jgi:hypothetical protein
MFIFINVLETKYVSSKFWVDINKQFKQQSSTWRPGRSIKSRGLLNEDEFSLFVMYVGLLYVAFLKQAAWERRFEKYWIPLNPKYLQYKKSHGFYENMWLSTSQLIDAIEIWYDKSNERVVVGIKDNVYKKIPGSKVRVKLLDICKFLEFGTCSANGSKAKCPPRPLFRLARDKISRNIGQYYREFSHLIDLIGE